MAPINRSHPVSHKLSKHQKLDWLGVRSFFLGGFSKTSLYFDILNLLWWISKTNSVKTRNSIMIFFWPERLLSIIHTESFFVTTRRLWKYVETHSYFRGKSWIKRLNDDFVWSERLLSIKHTGSFFVTTPRLWKHVERRSFHKRTSLHVFSQKNRR